MQVANKTKSKIVSFISEFTQVYHRSTIAESKIMPAPSRSFIKEEGRMHCLQKQAIKDHMHACTLKNNNLPESTVAIL